jgi:hypothetical protein
MISNYFIFFILLTMEKNGQPTKMEEGTNSTPSLEGDWKTLTQDNYTLQYPSSWELDQSGDMGSSFILFSPMESSLDSFQENVNLLIQDLTGMKIDLDKFTSISEDQVKTMIPNSNLIESVRLKTKSDEYHKIIYTGDLGMYHVKYEQYYWMINEKAYILTLTTELEKFDHYKETGERILNSFTFKKS